MQVAIPPEFELFARQQVEAGAFPSEEAAVAAALRDHLARVGDLRDDIQRGIASLDRGEGLDGETAITALMESIRHRSPA